jgi:hypothetical protein
MTQSLEVARAPRQFFVSATLLVTGSVAIGAFVLGHAHFKLILDLTLAIGGIAAAAGSQFRTPWSLGQRTCLLIAAGALGVAVGFLGQFVF